jgi:(p)ppGpp synthase/HD superfamily hydrolase
MTVTGYSDVVNHAFAFAAKHHDRQVRKGTKLPYLTHPANVAVILTRYGRDNETVVAGILHDVIEDCVRDGYSREMLEQRIGDKFGGKVLDTVLAVTYRRQDDDGIELSSEDRKSDYLERLASATEAARWVCAADKIHNASSIISDLRRTVDSTSVWNRFGGAKTATADWYRSVYERLRDVGFDAPIMSELDQVSKDLQQLAT